LAINLLLSLPLAPFFFDTSRAFVFDYPIFSDVSFDVETDMNKADYDQ